MELFKEVGDLYEQYKDSGEDIKNGDFLLKSKEIEDKYNCRLAKRLILDVLVDILQRKADKEA